MRKLILSIIVLLASTKCYAAAPDRPAGSVAVAGTIISSVAYNNDLNTIYNYLQNGVSVVADGTITNNSIATGAAIAYSKLNLTGSVTGSDIATNTITNTNIATGAVIDSFKLANITLAGKVSVASLIGNLGSTSSINNLFNGGSSASSSTFWRGDGTWQPVNATSQIFTASGSGSFTAPAGITKVYLTMQGGGGGGGGSATNGAGGGGGAGGAFIINYPYTVTPGNTYSLIVGAGGGKDVSGTATSFDSAAVSVPGGERGQEQQAGPTGGHGGTGGGGLNASASITTVSRTGNDLLGMQGGNGAKGVDGANQDGGAGGNTPFGIGGDGGVGNTSAGTSAAANTGAGGGGSAGASGGGGTNAGSGGSGFVIVSY